MLFSPAILNRRPVLNGFDATDPSTAIIYLPINE